jgi:hypothetical protein
MGRLLGCLKNITRFFSGSIVFMIFLTKRDQVRILTSGYHKLLSSVTHLNAYTDSRLEGEFATNQ